MLQVLSYGNKKKFCETIEARQFTLNRIIKAIKEGENNFPESIDYYRGQIEGMLFVTKWLSETESTELRRFHKQLEECLYKR